MPELVSRLVLASQSASRQAMLDAAGVSYDAIPADVDERAIAAGLANCAPGEVALALARAKADAVAWTTPGRVVLGGDSLVVVDGRWFGKPGSRDEAAEHLRRFSGREMALHSVAALVMNERLLWQCTDLAVLRVRPLSDAFIARYLDSEWPQVAACAGAFRIEAMGVQLFESIAGSHFTVLGLPLMPLLAQLRALGLLAG